MVLKCQVIGVQGHLESVSNTSALGDAPRLVMDNAFAMRTGRIGTVLVFVAPYGFFGDRHKILLDSRSPDHTVGMLVGVRGSGSGSATTATRIDNAPNHTGGLSLTVTYRPHMIAST